MNDTYAFFVGIDWAAYEHQVCVTDPDGKVIDECKAAHSHEGLTQMADQLCSLAGENAGRIAVAIEVPRGAVVETLLERGMAVFSINPKQLDRFRDRHTVAGAKDDRRDAFVLADSLRTDMPLYRKVRLDDAGTIQLRELSRMDEALCESLIRESNRLRGQLSRYWPQLLNMCPAADAPWMWALLQRAPTPQAARRLTRAGVASVLKKYRIRRLPAAEVLAAWKTPPLQVAPGTIEAAAHHVGILVEQLQLLHKQRTACQRDITSLLTELADGGEDGAGQMEKHRDAEIILSMPGIGKLVAATMLAQAGQALAERNYQALRVHTGIAPVTKQSGTRHHVVMRRACDRRLRNCVYHWARISVQRDPRSRAHYHALRSRGHGHGRALRSVADRLLKILVVMLETGTLYEPGHQSRVPPGVCAA